MITDFSDDRLIYINYCISRYGTGIAGGSSPRAIGATRTTSESLNKVLSPCFKLAYAGEDLVRLVDSKDVDYITERLKTFDAVVLSTVYQLELRSVTGNTYEKTPNDKTFEFYMDERYGANEDGAPEDDSTVHLELFRNSIRACKECDSIQHVVVLESPRTKQPNEFINILEKEGIYYTYITANHLKKDKTYSFDKGLREKLSIQVLPGGTSVTSETNDENAAYREDIAALIVQSLMTLSWNKSRIIKVSSTSENIAAVATSNKQRYDSVWCPNSNVYAEMLAAALS